MPSLQGRKAFRTVQYFPTNAGYNGAVTNLDGNIFQVEALIRAEAARLQELIRHKKNMLCRIKKLYKKHGIDISGDIGWGDFDRRHGIDFSGLIDTRKEADVNPFEEIGLIAIDMPRDVEPDDIHRWKELSERAGAGVYDQLKVRVVNFGFACLGYNRDALTLESYKAQLAGLRQRRQVTVR